MLTFRSLAPLAAAAVLSFAALPATAVTTCQFGTEAEFTATADVWTSTACSGEIAGNDSDQNGGAGIVNVNVQDGGLFGFTSWVLDSRYDQDDGTYNPDGILNISNITSNLFEGDWSVDSWDGVQAAMLVLKGGNGFAAYLLDMTAGLDGEWITQALTVGKKGNTPAISHISLYTVEVAAVPVPAAGLLLIGALGGLALLRRRRNL